MGRDNLYRWEKRRQKTLKTDKAFHMNLFDWVMLILVFFMLFFSIRLFFIFEVVTAPCTELILTAGQHLGYPPIFQLTFIISLLIGSFWLCVTLHRIFTRSAHWALIGWHCIMFISAAFLIIANWNLTSSSYVNPPDGIMVVENVTPNITETGVTWPTPPELGWSDYRDGRWYARGTQACIWLDENKVSYNDRFDLNRDARSAPKLFLKGRFLETLKDNQLYRPLTEYERSLFLDIKACQADITRYGQPASACQSAYTYPVPLGVEPSELFQDSWFAGYIQKSPLQ